MCSLTILINVLFPIIPAPPTCLEILMLSGNINETINTLTLEITKVQGWLFANKLLLISGKKKVITPSRIVVPFDLPDISCNGY